VLSQVITLLESRRPDHAELAAEVLALLLADTGGSTRVGITGVPGVGKSTFIDQFGINLCETGLSVAVLAVDPSSQRSGGSILGDKTRMSRLAFHPDAYIRPSPAGVTLGGVTRTTRETILVCEAAGFDVVLVETVGVGQSETIVAEMVDFFLVLMLAGAGDELQGIKKGVLEIADMIAVNKADGDNVTKAAAAASDYRHALSLTQPMSPSWSPPVVTCSGATNVGLDDIWTQVVVHRDKLTATGELDARRQDQQVRWMWSMVDDRLVTALRSHPAVQDIVGDVEASVRSGVLAASAAAEQLLAASDSPTG